MILNPLPHLLAATILLSPHQLISALEVHLASANTLLVGAGSESIETLLSSSLVANHANCHMLARLLKYRSFDFSRYYRPRPEWLQALVPFIVGEGLEEMLAGVLLPLQHLSPTRNAIGWSLIASHQDRLLRHMCSSGADWRPHEWPLAERKLILATMHSSGQRHRLSSLTFCKTLLHYHGDDDDDGTTEGVWDELLSISDDFWRLLDVNCVSKITPRQRIIPLYRRLEGLARKGDILAFFQLASFRRSGGHTSLVEPFLTALASFQQEEPHKWIMILTDPRFLDQKLLQEALGRLVAYFEELADQLITPLTGTQYILSTLDLWLSRHRDDDGPVLGALARLFKRYTPKDIIPVLLRRVLGQLDAWQGLLQDVPETWAEVLSGENSHWYLLPRQQLFTNRIASWRATILTVCRDRDRTFVDSIALTGITKTLDTYKRYPMNLLWSRPLGRGEVNRSELISLTEGLVGEAEAMLVRGEKVKIVDSERGPMVKFDCAQDTSSIRLFLLGMTVRLAVHAIRIPRLDRSLVDLSYASSQLDIQRQQPPPQQQHHPSVRQRVCIDPHRKDISEEQVQRMVRVIHDFFTRWQMDPTHYDLLTV